MRRAALFATVAATIDVSALRIDQHARRLSAHRRKGFKKDNHHRIESNLIQKSALRRRSTGRQMKLHPMENIHPNPFYKMDWWPQIPDPNEEEKQPESLSEEEIRAKEEAEFQAMQASTYDARASFAAESARKEADANELDEALKAKAEEQEAKAEEKRQAAIEKEEKAEQQRVNAIKETWSVVLKNKENLQSWRDNDFAACQKDYNDAWATYGSEIDRYNADVRNAWNEAFSRHSWWQWGAIIATVNQLKAEANHRLHNAENAWYAAQNEFDTCEREELEYTYKINDATQIYMSALGHPKTDYKGCFYDNEARAMVPDPSGPLSYSNFEECAVSCTKHGYHVMAMQWNSQCFCGNGDQHTKYGEANDDDCVLDWANCGAPGNKCGGGWTNAVYDIENYQKK